MNKILVSYFILERVKLLAKFLHFQSHLTGSIPRLVSRQTDQKKGAQFYFNYCYVQEETIEMKNSNEYVKSNTFLVRRM